MDLTLLQTSCKMCKFGFTLIVLVNLFWVAVRSDEQPRKEFAALSDELIEYVNNIPNGTWKAAKTSRFNSIEDVKKLLGSLPEPVHLRNARRPTISHADKQINLPPSFSSAEKWPNCRTISQIRDQSSCGSCWAFGAVTAMSDRVCVQSHGEKIVELSAIDLLSCCTDCGFGCEGGWNGPAWDFWMNEGLVTGGSKEDGSGCRPYPFPRCEHHTNGTYGPCPKHIFATPECRVECQWNYSQQYFQDKIYARSSYNLMHDEETIMKEIMLHGPVEAALNVYEDFANYRTGVYKHTTGKLIGGHSIRIVGWGIEDGVPYWHVANSWNEHWGDRGYFKILRGKNECGIESDVVAGIPRI